MPLSPSDKNLRRSILWTTTPLPRDLRVALRRMLLSRLEIYKAHNSPVLIIGHQKCGNTWLRTMLSRFYQLKYGLPSNLVVKSDELHNIDRRIPRIFCTNGHYSYQHVIAEAFEPATRDPRIADMPVVFIARHPCDIAVSWYHQFTKRESEAKVELINADLKRPIDRERVSLWEFARESELGVSAMIDYLNAWHERLKGSRNAHRISYESMRRDPQAILVKLLELYGESYTPEQISQTLEFSSFDNLQRLEDAGHFQAGGLARQRGRDPTTRKVRRGKIGGYRDDFTPEQVAELDDLVERHLDPSFGYSPAEFGARLAASE